LENSKPAFAPQDASMIKRCIEFYLKNGPYMTESEKHSYTNLFHRMGRIDRQTVLREPTENPDAPHLRETLFD